MTSTWRWLLVAAIAPLAWGSTYVVTSQLLPADSPVWGAAMRALPAGLVLLLLARRLPRGRWWWRSAVLGVLNVGAFFVLVYLAAQLLPSGVAAMLMATSPAVILLLAWPIAREKPAALSLVGAIVGFAGVVVLLAGATGALDLWGVAASLAAMLMSSVGFVLARRWNDGTPALSVTSWQLTMGGLALVPVALLVEGAPPALDAAGIAGAAYLALVATALAFATWFAALQHLPAGAVGLVGLLNPVAGVALGVLVAQETFTVVQVIGMVTVLLGIVLGQPAIAAGLRGARERRAARRARRRMVPTDTAQLRVRAAGGV
ncbi:DMT family transporter [Microcella frigidaquae]|uniref:Putative blue pigment (Indigoidine) exporter n=1 Tax=Microcella frigidaquae TaxID=424758 RepID=A0A840X8U0_9MICO|nr:DMT family transporter [Microcella frigidaquae]MBB5618641.1 putative blue pigment (indigoidine) exporter [Microcella frigidaquae]NHN44075.1 EamA family transporter [Microcella frigidaquae]